MARPGLLVCVFVHKPFLDDALVKLRRCVMALAQAPKPLYKNFFEALSGGVFGWSNRLKERIAVSEKTTVDIDGVWEIAPAFVAQCLGIAERSSLRSPDPHVCIRWSGPRSGIWEIRTAFVSIPCLHAACAVRLFRLMSPPSRGKVFMASDNTQQGAQNKRVNCAEKVAGWRRMKAWIASRRRVRNGSTTWSWMARKSWRNAVWGLRRSLSGVGHPHAGGGGDGQRAAGAGTGRRHQAARSASRSPRPRAAPDLKSRSRWATSSGGMAGS